MKQRNFDKIRTVIGGKRQNEKKNIHMPKYLPSRPAGIVVQAINQDNARTMGRSQQSALRSTISERSAEAQRTEWTII